LAGRTQILEQLAAGVLTPAQFWEEALRRIISTLAASLFLSASALAADPGVSDTEIKIGDVNIMTGPAAFVGKGVALGSKCGRRRQRPQDHHHHRGRRLHSVPFVPGAHQAARG
jgi:hypothetical protein